MIWFIWLDWLTHIKTRSWKAQYKCQGTCIQAYKALYWEIMSSLPSLTLYPVAWLGSLKPSFAIHMLCDRYQTWFCWSTVLNVSGARLIAEEWVFRRSGNIYAWLRQIFIFWLVSRITCMPVCGSKLLVKNTGLKKASDWNNKVVRICLTHRTVFLAI